MKIVKWIVVLLLLAGLLTGGLYLCGWYIQSPQQRACAEYFRRTKKYPVKTAEILSQIAMLDLRRDDWEKQARTLLSKWQALVPPDELKDLHGKVHESFLLEIDSIRAVKEKNIALADKYRREINNPTMKFLEEMKRIYREHGCEF